jgi:hypothetical protein
MPCVMQELRRLRLDMTTTTNHARQPTPGERLGGNRNSLARRGCAVR